MTANKASTSELDSGLAQLAPGTLVHSVWEDSDSVPPKEVEILAPSVGPEVPAQEVSFALPVSSELSQCVFFRSSSTCTPVLS